MANVRRIAVVLWCAATLAACGSNRGHDHTATWSDLTRVTVDVDQPGVPTPPGTKNTPTTFTTPGQLMTVTKALNANHIAEAAHTTTSSGCSGGIQIEITIVQRHHKPTDLSAYRCAETTTGDIAGNLTGFLKQIGVATA